MFSRATIRLGIGPHSGCVFVCWSHCQRKPQSLAADNSCTGCQNAMKFGVLIDQAQLYVSSKICKLWSKGSSEVPESTSE